MRKLMQVESGRERTGATQVGGRAGMGQPAEYPPGGFQLPAASAGKLSVPPSHDRDRRKFTYRTAHRGESCPTKMPTALLAVRCDLQANTRRGDWRSVPTTPRGLGTDTTDAQEPLPGGRTAAVLHPHHLEDIR